MTTQQQRSAADDGLGPAEGAVLNPGTRSWKPRAHPLSRWTLLVTTGAILMTSIDGWILLLAAIVLVALIPLSRLRETVGVAGHRR